MPDLSERASGKKFKPRERRPYSPPAPPILPTADNYGTITEQLRNNSVIDGIPKITPEQLRNDSINNTEQLRNNYGIITELYGNEKVVMEHLISITNPQSFMTDITNFEKIAVTAKVRSAEVVRVTINKLKDKGLVKKVESRRGPGSFIRLSFDSKIFNSLIVELRNNYGIITEKIRNNSENILPSSSSRDNLNLSNKLTATEAPEWVDEIDLCDLKGMGKLQLLQLIDRAKGDGVTLQRDVIQNSLYAFAFDESKGIFKNIDSLPGFIISVLRKGLPYTSPDPTYESPKMAALRIYTEQQEAEANKLQELEAKAKKARFVTWWEEVTVQERQERWPDAKGPLLLKFAEQYFNSTIWPHERLERKP